MTGERLASLAQAALAHAARRGRAGICLIVPARLAPRVAADVLALPGLGALCAMLDDRVEGLAALDARRLGAYFADGDWAPPPGGCAHAYLAGAPTLLTPRLLRGALNADLETLTVGGPGGWVDVPLALVKTAREAVLVPFHQWREARRAPALERAFRAMAAATPPRADAVPRRVALVCANLSPGGAERQVGYTARALAAAPLESVTVLCHGLDPGARRQLDFHLEAVRSTGVEVREIRRRASSAAPETVPPALRPWLGDLPQGLATDIADLIREFEELKPEVVHAWLDWDNTRAGLAALIAGVPRVVLSGRNLRPTHFTFHQPYMLPAYQALMASPRVTMVNNSRAGADDYADWIGIPATRVGVVPNAIDLPQPARLRAPAERPLIGGVFRFAPEKRPLLWLDTAAEILRRRPDARFLIHGPGPLEAKMRERAARLGLADRVTFGGLTRDVGGAMAAMDMLLLTSAMEGLPNVLIEAQWAGTPVVTTAVGGAPEAIDPGVTGLAVDGADPALLAEAVVGRLADEAWLAAARAAGPAHARARFGLDALGRNTLAACGY